MIASRQWTLEELDRVHPLPDGFTWQESQANPMRPRPRSPASIESAKAPAVTRLRRSIGRCSLALA
jgi:hypothetical protein